MSFDNLVQTTLGMPLTAVGAVITLVDAVSPNKLPPTDGGVVVLADSLGRPSFVEIISYTARTGLNLTGVVRGLEGTTAQAWPVGAYLYQPLTASGYQAGLDSKKNSLELIVDKTAAYTVVASDLNKIINCTSGSFTVGLTTAATLGAGFSCWVWNSSPTDTDVVTVDPFGSEKIDGVATLKLGLGEGLQVICNGVGWQVGGKKVMRGYAENFSGLTGRPIASGRSSIALGAGASTFNTASLALGFVAYASGPYSTAIGGNSIGGGAKAMVGAGAMALGGSYASGADSFAAANANNTGSYGASTANSVAIGYQAKASGNYSSVVGGYYNVAGGIASFACGSQCLASAGYSVAYGQSAVADKYGKKAFASGKFVVAGDSQAGKMVLRSITTNRAPTALTSDGSAESTTNQVILPNYSTFTFRIQVVAMQKRGDGTKTAGYEFTGVIVRGPGVASVVIKNSTKNVLYEDDAAWDCNVSADGENGGLAITVTGAAATNIAWVATVDTTEVTYL